MINVSEDILFALNAITNAIDRIDVYDVSSELDNIDSRLAELNARPTYLATGDSLYRICPVCEKVTIYSTIRETWAGKCDC